MNSFASLDVGECLKMEDEMSNLLMHALLVFVASILATAYLVPKIISIVRFKKLMDSPNERSSHISATPSLGGMAFFIVLMIALYFNHRFDTFGVSTSLYPALTILFFLGLKDDLVVLAPKTKLIGQTLSCLFILFNSKFEISTLHGFFGIDEINPWMGFAIGLIVMLAVINAFNLIDGIDGLAASVGIVAFSGFAVVFFSAERYFLFLICLTMVGMLIGFLFFNLSAKNKIFMGDTGSMLLGFMLGAMSVRFLTLDHESINRLPFNAVDIPIVIISFLIVPLFDTGRVFIIRLLNGKGVFSPDRNHLHHVLIDAYKLSHRRASFYIANVNIIGVIVFSIVLKLSNIYVASAFIVLTVIIAAVFLHKIKRKKFGNLRQGKALIKTRQRRTRLQQIQEIRAGKKFSSNSNRY